jgi:Spy/CpxP family protein refolding chaperone
MKRWMNTYTTRILAIVLTAGTLGVFAEEAVPHGGRGRPGEDGPQHGPEEMLIHRLTRDPELAGELGISEDQVAQLNETAYALRKRHVELRAKLEVAAMEQARLMSESGIDEQALMAAVEATGAVRTEMAKLRVQQLLAIRNILTEEQRQAIRKYVRSRLRERMHERRTDQHGPQRSDERRARYKGRFRSAPSEASEPSPAE